MSHDVVKNRVVDEVRNALRDVISELKLGHSGLVRVRLEELINVVENTGFHGIVAYYELPVEAGRIDIDVFNRVIFEVKVSEREFQEAEDAIKKKYIPSHASASYAIVTNHAKWRFYKVVNGDVVFDTECDENTARVKLREIFSEILRGGWGLYPGAELVLAIFRDVISSYKELLRVLNDNIGKIPSIRPLYTAFKTMMITIYHDLSEDDIKKLFVIHTLLQMITASALSDALNISHGDPKEKCKGSNLPVEVALPYLTWWYISYKDLSESDKRIIDDVVNRISIKSSLINWRARATEDVFRELYEYFIDPETRRKIGEYYTPLWVVEFMINQMRDMGMRFRDNIVLDPFCGSGTFLVMSFYEKIAEGEDPDNAFLEVIGFDLNPLAVSIARAELIMAYLRSVPEITDERKIPSPLVFHADTIEPFETLTSFVLSVSSAGSLPFKELNDFRLLVNDFLSSTKHVSRDAFKELQSVEKRFLYMLREASICMENGNKEDVCVKNSIRKWIKPEFFSDKLIREFMKFLTEDVLEKFSSIITNLLKSYGNGVWATPFTSLLSLLIITRGECDIVLTNPPWLQLTKHKATYIKLLRETAKSLVSKAGVSSSDIVKGSDLASIALFYGIKMAKEAVGYVMPREASFYHKTAQRAGQILTYATLKSFQNMIDRVMIIDMNYDVFQHGNLPSLILVKKGGAK